MTPPMPAGGGGNECRGELLGRSRRGALTDAGRLALDAHLAACASCRMAGDVLGDFDQVDLVDIRDGARIRAMVDRARAARTGAGARGRARGPRRLRAAATAAALIVCGGSASAAVWWFRQPAPAAPPAAARPAVAALQEVPRASVRHAAAPAAAAPTVGDPPRPTPTPAHRTPARKPAASDGGHLTAAALLAEAGRARGDGQIDRATSLYRRLRREYPGTPEALVAAVPLGRLLVDRGAARPALAAFDGYLRDMPRGPLVAEALYGKGRALEALGDGAEERLIWERLLADHAGSAYAPHARRRLAALR
jgi:TolA-binding protein